MSIPIRPRLDVAPPPGTGRSMPRREFLRLVALAAGGAASFAWRPRPSVGQGGWVPSFHDGGKAGDPHPNRGVIWSRIPAPKDGRSVDVMWSAAEDPDLQHVVRGGLVTADAAHGHSVKVLVRGLAPDRWYYYRFESEGVVSAT